eukprot:1182723-Prorocentrum_minimum.AAC.1
MKLLSTSTALLYIRGMLTLGAALQPPPPLGGPPPPPQTWVRVAVNEGRGTRGALSASADKDATQDGSLMTRLCLSSDRTCGRLAHFTALVASCKLEPLQSGRAVRNLLLRDDRTVIRGRGVSDAARGAITSRQAAESIGGRSRRLTRYALRKFQG